MLRFPHQSSPARLTPFEPYPRLFTAFAEAGEWLDRLGIRSAGAFNDAILDGRLQEVSLVAEALHEARIAASRRHPRGQEEVRVVLIAGPSSSGKTTFSKRLAVQLLASGRRPFAVALDDYFVDRDETPRDERGELDFEVLEALDVRSSTSSCCADGGHADDAAARTGSSTARARGAPRDTGAARCHRASKASTG